MESLPRTRGKIWLWALYDFANSLAFVNVLFSFGLWFISENGASDLWISVSVALTTIVLLLSLPVLGRMSDRMGRRLPFLAASTFLSIGALLTLGIVAAIGPVFTLPVTILVFLIYSLFNLFYMACFPFYDSLLRSLKTRNNSLEGVSGIGMGAGQVGNIVGITLLLPIATGKISLFGITGKGGVFIAAAILFLLASLPVFLYFREEHVQLASSEKLGKTLRETFADFRRIRQYPGVFAYLITYALFADALLTLSVFTSFYLDTVAHMDDTQKTMTFVLAMIFGIIGALMSPLFVRIFRGRKNAVTACIAFWAVVLAGFAFAHNTIVFSIFVVLNGFGFGALFALSRAFFAALVPPAKQAEMFGIYAIFERTASVLGPLLWSATAFAFASYGDDRYRFSVIALAILIVISLFTFQYVREPESFKE